MKLGIHILLLFIFMQLKLFRENKWQGKSKEFVGVHIYNNVAKNYYEIYIVKVSLF